MTFAKISLAGAAVLTLIGTAALAEEPPTGMVTKIDRLNRTIAIQQIHAGTVGANSAGSAEEYKAQEGLSLDEVHAGDRVHYTVTQTGGTKTITKLERKK